MNIVDSSGWLEYFADGPNTAFFSPLAEISEVHIIEFLTHQGCLLLGRMPTIAMKIGNSISNLEKNVFELGA